MGDSRPIGTGQSGEVLAVEGEDVVIKRYVPSETYSADQFRQEIVNARTAHGIIPDGSPEVLDSDDDRKSGRPWFAMPRVKPVYGPCPKKTAVAHILRLLELCIRLRNAGWLHGDIKVENLCLVNGRLGLLDFASMMPVEVANTHDVQAGSDFYRAPETDCDRIVDERTEVHAIAVTFVKLAPWSTAVRYAVPLLRALMPFPWLRYQTFEDFRRGIEREPRRLKRLVWLGAAVWKFRMTLRTIAIIATGIVIMTGLLAIVFYRTVSRIHQQSIQTAGDYETGKRFYDDATYTDAIRLLTPIAESDCLQAPLASQILSDCYRLGLGVETNPLKRIDYKRRCEAVPTPRSRFSGPEASLWE